MRELFFSDMRLVSPNCEFHTLTRSLLTYLNILINSFLLSLHMNLPNSFIPTIKTKLPIPKSSHVRTIKTNPALHASSLLHKKPPFQRSTAPSSKQVPRKHTQYRMKIRKHCPCCTAQNLPITRISQRTPPPSLRRYRARQKNFLHSDRQLGDTKHALADMDGRVCASQVAEQSMQHPAKGRQKARSCIEADLLDCPNRIACLLPYPSCPATTKKQTSATERVGGRRYDFGNLRISSTQSQKRTRDPTSDGRSALPLRAHKQLSRL